MVLNTVYIALFTDENVKFSSPNGNTCEIHLSQVETKRAKQAGEVVWRPFFFQIRSEARAEIQYFL